MYPHFYCDRCSNAFFSRAQHERVDRATVDTETLTALEAELPSCPCGGRFRPGANPKCPACSAEVGHRHDLVSRLTDPFLVLVEGSALFGPGE